MGVRRVELEEIKGDLELMAGMALSAIAKVEQIEGRLRLLGFPHRKRLLLADLNNPEKSGGCLIITLDDYRK